MKEDPAPLRYRTYLWFPIVVVSVVALLTAQRAATGGSGGIRPLFVVVLPALFPAAFLGCVGLYRDATALASADAAWHPSWRRYAVLLGALTVALAVVAFVPPVAPSELSSLSPSEYVGLPLVSLTIAACPVCVVYLGVRWRRQGLNYL